MTRIVWDRLGEKRYETGVDRGVLYPESNTGVPWNGLVSIQEKAVGGEASAYYVDGVKYFNEALLEEFEATISAYTYPPELDKLQGLGSTTPGLYYGEQPRGYFHLSYRTMIGNDTESVSRGYRIHIIHNVLTHPSDRSRNTMDDSPEADLMTWDVTTLPKSISGRKPTAHFVVDSTLVSKEKLLALENILYGTSRTRPRMPTIDEMVTLFDDWPNLEIMLNRSTGLSPIKYHSLPDLKGNTFSGLYPIPEYSRLKQSTTPGLYTLEI